MTRLKQSLGLAALLVTLLAGCQAATDVVPDAQLKLDASNATNLGLEIIVNGSKAADLPAGQQVELMASSLPPLPWTAVVQLPGGRSIVSLTVRSGDVRSESGGQRGDGARVDLSCGRIDLWSGPPMLGPVPGTGTPGDCAP